MTTKPKTPPTPGPKPDFAIVEKHLKCQTDEGEVSIDLRIPLERLELFMDMESLEPKDIPKYVRDRILWPEDKDKLLEMRDGAKALEILMQVAKSIGERVGASVGESSGSHEPSEPIAQPSDSTSVATSDSL